MCVFSYPPFLFFYSSSPFLFICNFFFSVLCPPFFSLFLSLVFFRSVKISSFSLLSSSRARFFSPCYIVDVLLLFFLVLLLLLLLPHLFAIFLLSLIFCFLKIMVFKKHTTEIKARTRQNFGDAPKTPIFIVVSGDQAEEAEICKTPISRVYAKRGHFWTPFGKGGDKKLSKNLKIHAPKIQNFRHQQQMS